MKPSIHGVAVMPCAKRVRVQLNGLVIADSRAALLVRSPPHALTYYFPRAHCRLDLFSGGAAGHVPGVGRVERFDLAVGRRRVEAAAWVPLDGAAEGVDLRSYVAFEWALMDAWLEEDEEVYVHPHDPGVRIDVLNSSRHVQVIVGGEPVAESCRPVLLFETGLTVRYYLPKVDVRSEFLRPSAHSTRCPYKGEAAYYSLALGERVYENVCWYYRYPLAEVAKIAGLIAFYPERVDAFLVDGVAVNHNHH